MESTHPSAPWHDSVFAWCRALQQGDQDAARKLYERYVEPIRRAARKRLNARTRRIEDESDVANAVLKSLLSGLVNGQFPRLSDATDLWMLVLAITWNKTIDAVRRAQRHAAEVGESALGDPATATMDRLDAGDPTPSAQAEIADRIDWLLAQLHDESLKQVVLMKLEGYTNAEIAQAIGKNVRTVERKLNAIRDILQHCLNDGTADRPTS
jgi:RNA polymerase sigma factor (sigma-70 family)